MLVILSELWNTVWRTRTLKWQINQTLFYLLGKHQQLNFIWFTYKHFIGSPQVILSSKASYIQKTYIDFVNIAVGEISFESFPLACFHYIDWMQWMMGSLYHDNGYLLWNYASSVLRPPASVPKNWHVGQMESTQCITSGALLWVDFGWT